MKEMWSCFPRINCHTLQLWAFIFRSYDCVRLLLDGGADVNHKVIIFNQLHRTAVEAIPSINFHLTFVCKKLFKVPVFIISKCCVLFLKDRFGYSPLHIAALNEYSYCANMLLAYGADITARTKGGTSGVIINSIFIPLAFRNCLSMIDTISSGTNDRRMRIG